MKDPDSASNPVGLPASIPIVGIGASAGGLEALTELLKQLPPDTGPAFVIIQHLDPNHASNLSSLLARVTKMPVSQVTEGMPVKANHVYVVPPNSFMRAQDGILKLEPRQEIRGINMPIDHFFRSLAQNHGSRAIGMILSGTGSDGALGLEEIKDSGGITFVQDEKTAKFSGMPHSAIATGAADFILPVEGIAEELVRLSRHPYVASPSPINEEEKPQSPTSTPPDPLNLIFRLLRMTTGVDFSYYRNNTIQRRITRRMTLRRMERLEEYASHLKNHPDELKALYHDLLIKVTGFFRDPGTYEALKQTVIPGLLKNHPAGKPIRIWVPGCASGEEVYSIAICFIECLGGKAADTPIRIFATDVDEEALQKARGGFYIENISLDVSPERLRRFFSRVDLNYRVNNSIREMCTFARHDLCKDPPFSNLDLVSCRNLMIYFDPLMQKRILPIFHYALNPEGFLTLGTSETIGIFSDLFTLLDKKQKIYSRKAGSEPASANFAAGAYRAEETKKAGAAERRDEPLRRETDAYKEADQILMSDYAPSGVLVNEQMDILQFRGETGRYLTPAPGKARLNLLNMAREGLLVEISTAIEEAKTSGRPALRKGIRLHHEGKKLEFTLKVIPLKLPAPPNHFLVLFEEPAATLSEANGEGRWGNLSQWLATPFQFLRPGSGPVTMDTEPEENRSLKQELESTKRYLQSTVENQEATNEELKSANEEVLSSNEELQSTNEELETAKEELQSSNEELHTTNEEMQRQNLELSQANDDMNNLFSSANLPVLMLGKDLRIRRFTQMTEKLLNVIPADVGRPLRDLQLNFDLPTLEPLLLAVIETTIMKELEIQDRQGHWYLMRIQPYKTSKEKVEGAVLFFIDIDSLKGVEKLVHSLEELRISRNYSEGIVQTVRKPLLMLDVNLRVISANPAFYRMFQTVKEATENRCIYDLGNGQWNIPELQVLFNRAFSEKGEFEDFEIHHNFPEIGQKSMLLNAKRIVLDGMGTAMILCGIEDITERRHAEEQVKMVRENLEHLVSQRTGEVIRYQEKVRQGEKLEAIGQLAGGVAHDFNNLITGILGIAEDLKTRLQNDPVVIDDLEQIIKAGRRASGVTKQLLAIGRKQLLQPVVLDINRVILDLKVMLKHLLGENVHLKLELGEIERILIDRSNMEQVIMNFAINARDAMPNGGTLTLRTFNREISQEDAARGIGVPAGCYVKLEAVDTGHGMSPETLARIFEPFFTTKEKEAGTGLGLAMVYGIIKQNGGHIRVDSSPGKGASFKIYFPGTDAKLSPLVKAHPRDEQPKGQETILVVEDEDIVRRVVVNQLRRLEYTVLEAENGLEALKLLELHPERIHLLITDVIMPGLNGREVADKIRETRDGIPVLYMSGYTQEVITSRGNLDPGLAFIEKSDIHTQLSLKVRELLDPLPPPA